jgi:hypothetical protein
VDHERRRIKNYAVWPRSFGTMSDDGPTTPGRECIACGFEAAAGSDAWETADHPSLGALTRCPECGSTDVHSRA